MSHTVLEILKDTPQYRSRRLVKSGETGETYTTSIRKKDGVWACSCKGWIFKYQKLGVDCKHLVTIRETYGDKGRSDGIIAQVTTFGNSLFSIPARDASVALGKWQTLSGSAGMLLFYFENTPTEQVRAISLAASIDSINAQLRKLALS
jgi:hypothetical protein